MALHLLRNNLFKYFCSDWKDTNWSILIILVSGTNLETGVKLANFKEAGKIEEQIASLNWQHIYSAKTQYLPSKFLRECLNLVPHCLFPSF